MQFSAFVLPSLLLLAILIVRGHLKRFPLFFTYIVVLLACCIASHLSASSGNIRGSSSLALTLSCLEGISQLGVLFELTRTTFRSSGRYSRRDERLVSFAFALLLLTYSAGTLGMIRHKWPGIETMSSTLRLDLFTNVMVAVVLTALLITVDRLRLFLSHWASGISGGLTILVLISLTSALLRAYEDPLHAHAWLQYLQLCGFLGALGLWCVSLWRLAPYSKRMPPDMRDQLTTLSEELNQGLDRLDQHYDK